MFIYDIDVNTHVSLTLCVNNQEYGVGMNIKYYLSLMDVLFKYQHNYNIKSPLVVLSNHINTAT